jgi:hypothetical protein
VAVHLRPSGQTEHLRQTAGVVIVAVAEHDGIDLAQVQAEGTTVVRAGFTLAGVEQHVLPRGADVQRQTVFRGQTRCSPVVDQDGDGGCFRFHGASRRMHLPSARASGWPPARSSALR